MNHPKDLLWTPAPTYAFTLDRAVVITTLKQGTSYLSRWITNGVRARYNVDLLNQNVIPFPADTESGEWKPNNSCQEEDIEKIKKSSCIDLNLILMGTNVKKTILIIRNPFNRLISSILEDTVCNERFLLDGRISNLYSLYDALAIPKPEFKYKNNTWKFERAVSDIQASIYYEFIVSQWVSSVQERNFFKAGHFIPQWESFIYSLITQENFNRDKCEIIDLDHINLADILIKNTVSKKWKNESKLELESKTHEFDRNFKEEMINHTRTKSKFLSVLEELIRVDSWFYQILKKERDQTLKT